MSGQVTDALNALETHGFEKRAVLRNDGALKRGMVVFVHPSGTVLLPFTGKAEDFAEIKAEAYIR